MSLEVGAFAADILLSLLTQLSGSKRARVIMTSFESVLLFSVQMAFGHEMQAIILFVDYILKRCGIKGALGLSLRLL